MCELECGLFAPLRASVKENSFESSHYALTLKTVLVASARIELASKV